MNITILQEKFSKALIHINRAINTRPNIPVLANVLIETTKNGLKLSSTNLDMGIVIELGAEVKEPGRTTVSARLLSEFVSSIKPGKLEIIGDDKKLVVNSVDNNAEFFTISADDFPALPASDEEPLTKVNAIDFANSIDKVVFSAAQDNSRPVLTGVLTNITKRNLTFVAVDSFRLSLKVMKLSSGPKDEYKQIIPAKSLAEVGRIIKDVCSKEDEVEIYSVVDNNQVIFKIGEIQLASRLIEGTFPPFEDIIPKQKQSSFSVLRGDFLESVKIVSIFARNVIGNKTRFFIDKENNKLILRTVVVDIGRNETKVDIINVEGEGFETAFNAKFILDMINSMDSDEIVFESNGITAPGVFMNKGDESYIHIIMPMRLE